MPNVQRSMPTTLRFATSADAPELADIYRPAVLGSAISFEIEPPDAATMAARVSKTLPHYPWLVCVQHDRVQGYAYATAHRERPAYLWSVETSVYVRAESRHQGIGRTLYIQLMELLRRQGYVTAYAGISLPNPASERLHAAVGFESVGVFRGAGYKLGAWYDVSWWQKSLGMRPVPPQPPVSLVALQCPLSGQCSPWVAA